MARLPSTQYIIQQSDGLVTLTEDGTERVIASFDPADADDTARTQKAIYDSPLGDEDKCFAHFWSGYFHAHATSALDGLIRAVLEALCEKQGLSLDSEADPGTPARNYELALRLGIGQVFGIPE